MKYDDVQLASCSGPASHVEGDQFTLNLNLGVGVVYDGSLEHDEAAHRASAAEGVVSVDLLRSIDRERLFSILLDPPDGLTTESVSAHTHVDGDTRQVTLETLSEAPVANTIVRDAQFNVDGGVARVEYSRGRFRTDSEHGLTAIRDSIAPRLV